MPAELKRLWWGGRPPLERPLKMDRREFNERVRLQADLRTSSQAEMVTDAVFAALKE